MAAKTIPERLFKYYPPQRIDVLENRLVCFSNRTQLNDPSEGISTFRKFLKQDFKDKLSQTILSNDKDKYIFDSVENMALEHGLGPNQARIFARSISENREFRRQAVSIMESLFPSLSNALEQFVPKEIENASNKIGVFSMTENNNSDQMWAYYGDNGYGFIVELVTSSFFFNNAANESSIKKVIYESREIDSFFDVDDTDIFCRKESDWSHEKEWRAFKITDDCDLMADSGHSLFRIPPDAISCIILGDKSSPEIQNRAAEAARSNGWEVNHAQLPSGSRKRIYNTYP